MTSKRTVLLTYKSIDYKIKKMNPYEFKNFITKAGLYREDENKNQNIDIPYMNKTLLKCIVDKDKLKEVSSWIEHDVAELAYMISQLHLVDKKLMVKVGELKIREERERR